MAKMVKGLYVPEPKDVANGRYTPDSNVSGRRFEPDGNGGGTLFIRQFIHRAGFRKPVEAWVKIRKTPITHPAMSL